MKIKSVIAAVLCALTVISASFTTAYAVVGDVNGDGKALSSDARIILRCSARLETMSAAQKSKADLNMDGSVNSADARILLRATAKLCSLVNHSSYYMQAVYTNRETGTLTHLDTAWQNGKLLINLNESSALIYDGKNKITMVDHRKKQYAEYSFDEFKRLYPKNASYFENGGRAFCFSDNLPTPMYLEDCGFSKSVKTENGKKYYVYRKNFSNGSQTYTFSDKYVPVKSEFYAGGSLMTLDFVRFEEDPSKRFNAHLSYRKVGA